MFKGRKIIAAVSAMIMALTSIAAISVSAADYKLGTATVPTVVADITTGATTNAGDTVKADIYIDGLGSYVGKYVDSYTINISAADGASEYLDLANATVAIDNGLAATLSESIMVNSGKWIASASQIRFAFTASGAAGKFAMENGLIGTITIPLLKDLDKEVSLNVSKSVLTLRDEQGKGNYYYIGNTDVNNVKNNVGSTGAKQGIVVAANMGTIAPVSAEKHVEVAVKNAKGEAVNLDTPNYNYSDVNGDVAVAFMATVTPNNDTVNGLTWTVKSGDLEKQFAKTFGGTITGAAVSYGLIVKGIDTVQSVNAAASVVAATE